MEEDFQYTGDLIKYNMLPNNYQKISYKKLEKNVYTFYKDKEDESNLSDKLNSKFSTSDDANENSNQNNQISNNNNNNDYINSNNTENKEKQVELKVDKKNNLFISEENKIEPTNCYVDARTGALSLKENPQTSFLKKKVLEDFFMTGNNSVALSDYSFFSKVIMFISWIIKSCVIFSLFLPNFNTNQNNQNLDSKKNNKKKLIKRIKKKDRRREKPDEIRTRIKNKFHKFSFNYLNYLIREENKNIQKIKFRKIEYKKIFGGNKKQNKEFLQKKFKDLIEENNITPKYKNKKPELNKKHLKNYDLNDNLCNNNLNESKVFNFLNLKMELIFNDYFLNKKPEKDFLNQKRKKKVKILFFDDFIEELKDKKEDENYIEKVKEVAKNYVSFYNNVKEKDESISSKKRNLFYTYQCK